MPILGAESSSVQSPMVRYAQEIGWTLVPQATGLNGNRDMLYGVTWSTRAIASLW